MYGQQGHPPLNPSAPPAGTGIAPHPQGHPPPQGYPQQGYPQQGYPQQGYPPQGYPPQPGHPPHGYPAQPVHTAPSDAESTRGMLPGNQVGQGDDDWAGSSFSDKAIRMGFIRKVYSIVMIQLTFTTAVTLFFCFHEPTKRWVQAHSWIYYPSYALFLVVYIALVCCKTCRRKWPLNIICLIIFTLTLTYMTAMISSTHDKKSVLVALGITVAVSIAISLFSCQTKYDFTKCSGILLAIVVALVASGIILGVWYVTSRNHEDRKILHGVLGCIAGLLASVALAITTQLLIGNKKNKLSEEEYIYAALQIYMNITDIFQSALCCLQLCSCC